MLFYYQLTVLTYEGKRLPHKDLHHHHPQENKIITLTYVGMEKMPLNASLTRLDIHA